MKTKKLIRVITPYGTKHAPVSNEGRLEELDHIAAHYGWEISPYRHPSGMPVLVLPRG